MRVAVLLVTLLLFAAPATGQVVRQLTTFSGNLLESYAVDDAGSMVFFVSDIDPLGTNPDKIMQVFRKTLPGTVPVQVTALDANVSMVSVSDDGSAVLFRSTADPLGFNADSGPELFLTDADGGSMVQLTDHAAGRDVREAVLSGDGGTALFISDGDLAAQNPSLLRQLFAVDTNGTNLRQLTLALEAGLCSDIAISDDGQRIVFIDDRDLTGSNDDRTYELFAVAGDGTGMTQVTNKADVQAAAIAGQGTPILYQEYGDLYQIDWGSNHSTYLVSGSDPGVTDLGDLVYYFDSSVPRVLFRIDPEDDPVVPVEVWSAGTIGRPVVSGAGTCLLFSLTGEGAPFLSRS
jgi:Tol biopolymer transport system component